VRRLRTSPLRRRPVRGARRPAPNCLAPGGPLCRAGDGDGVPRTRPRGL